MSDLSVTDEDWRCPGGGQLPTVRLGGRGICAGCGDNRCVRGDGMMQLHAKPGRYHPNKDPHKPPPLPRSTRIHITIMGEVSCRGEGCPHCADDHRFIVGLMQFALEELSISDERLAEELATKWEENDGS